MILLGHAIRVIGGGIVSAWKIIPVRTRQDIIAEAVSLFREWAANQNCMFTAVPVLEWYERFSDDPEAAFEEQVLGLIEPISRREIPLLWQVIRPLNGGEFRECLYSNLVGDTLRCALLFHKRYSEALGDDEVYSTIVFREAVEYSDGRRRFRETPVDGLSPTSVAQDSTVEGLSLSNIGNPPELNNSCFGEFENDRCEPCDLWRDAGIAVLPPQEELEPWYVDLYGIDGVIEEFDKVPPGRYRLEPTATAVQEVEDGNAIPLNNNPDTPRNVGNMMSDWIARDNYRTDSYWVRGLSPFIGIDSKYHVPITPFNTSRFFHLTGQDAYNWVNGGGFVGVAWGTPFALNLYGAWNAQESYSRWQLKKIIYRSEVLAAIMLDTGDTIEVLGAQDPNNFRPLTVSTFRSVYPETLEVEALQDGLSTFYYSPIEFSRIETEIPLEDFAIGFFHLLGKKCDLENLGNAPGGNHYSDEDLNWSISVKISVQFVYETNGAVPLSGVDGACLETYSTGFSVEVCAKNAPGDYNRSPWDSGFFGRGVSSSGGNDVTGNRLEGFSDNNITEEVFNALNNNTSRFLIDRRGVPQVIGETAGGLKIYDRPVIVDMANGSTSNLVEAYVDPFVYLGALTRQLVDGAKPVYGNDIINNGATVGVIGGGR